MTRLAPIALLLGLALLVPASARANGDPASDVLLTQQTFIPYEAPIPGSAADELRKTVAAANAKGYKIRVAVIAFTGDLGTAVSLWRHPQDYAKFLASEIAFVTTDRLLVAMPSGWGLYNRGKPVTKEQAVLAKVKPGATPTLLAESAGAAVRALAAADGVTVPKPSGSSGAHDRLILGAAAAAFLLILVFPARRLRRSRSEGKGASASERVR
jgi:hypothetical protein